MLIIKESIRHNLTFDQELESMLKSLFKTSLYLHNFWIGHFSLYKLIKTMDWLKHIYRYVTFRLANESFIKSLLIDYINIWDSNLTHFCLNNANFILQ